MVQRKLLGASLFALLSLFISSQLFAQEAIEQRQKLMKGQSAAAKAIKGAVEAKDYAAIETKAKDIMGSSDKIVDLFPKGSTSDKSRALPAIWEKWDEFGKNPAKLKKAAGELADAAKAKDDAGIPAKVKALGDACTACHTPFRAEKKG